MKLDELSKQMQSIIENLQQSNLSVTSQQQATSDEGRIFSVIAKASNL